MCQKWLGQKECNFFKGNSAFIASIIYHWKGMTIPARFRGCIKHVDSEENLLTYISNIALIWAVLLDLPPGSVYGENQKKKYH